MQRAIKVARAEDWPAQGQVGSVTLGYDDRHRRRLVLTTDTGREVLLDLPQAVVLHDGDGLLLDDGGWITVHAAEEDLLEIVAPDPATLVRIAWHIGNRHCPAQFQADRILIRDDPVMAEMLTGLGATVGAVHAPFNPERGAYAPQDHQTGAGDADE